MRCGENGPASATHLGPLLLPEAVASAKDLWGRAGTKLEFPWVVFDMVASQVPPASSVNAADAREGRLSTPETM